MAKKKSSRRRRLKGRDERGRFIAGFSGNPHGRPPKEPELPKLLDELIAEKLWQKVPITGADGKKRKISAYERIIEDLVDSLATAKPREKMQILEWMEKRSLFHHMRVMASDDATNPFDEEYETWRSNRKQVQALSRLARFG